MKPHVSRKTNYDMATATPEPPDLPADLVNQYKDALARIEDLRLVILLAFNAFEEVMRAFAAWRLGCTSDDLPKFLTNSPAFLFQVVQAGSTDKELGKQIQAFSELRNTVAHKFHQRTWKTKASAFVANVLAEPWPDETDQRRTMLIDAAFTIAINVAGHIDDLPARGPWPFPHLSLELVHAKKGPPK